MRLSFVFVALALLAGWLHAPLWAGGVLGAPHTDVFRAVWGFDHQAQAFPQPLFTQRVSFPDGATVLILPFVSSLLGAPLHEIFGPWVGYSLWVVGLAWAGASATAWWVKESSGSGAAGLLAGAAMLTQPLLLLAETEGTPEHLAYWPLPLMLGCLWRSPTAHAARWGAGAGVLGLVLALDNPYAAIYAVLLVLYPLFRAPRPAQLAFLATSAVGALLVAGIYSGLALDTPVADRNANAVSFLTWQDWEQENIGKPWDFTHPPAFVPRLTIAVALALALLAPRRSWPWLFAAAACFCLSLGSAEENGVVLARVFGAAGTVVGDTLGWINDRAIPSIIRFPRRWLVPCAFALWTAAGLGLARVPQEWLRAWIALPLALFVTTVTLNRTGFDKAFPVFFPPVPAFASFVNHHSKAGAVLLLPARGGGERSFAEFDDAIRGADHAFLQVALGRSVVNAPPDLLTVQTKHSRPPSRIGYVSGLEFVVIDEKAVGADLRATIEPFLGHVVETRHFNDGTGVTVLVLDGV